MHEWLEALQKSAKTTSSGVAAEELRRAETESGVPLPGELGDLYSVFNGGTFEGDVVLYPLHAIGEQASVLEKTRKMLVGLPVAGVWRFGLKGSHRHLYTARKSAMMEQGDGGGPLPEWVQALGDEDWIYGTWDEDKKEMRFYRSLANMLSVLVPPVEREEFGDRTFARAIAAVEGALTELAGTGEGAKAQDSAVAELQYEYEEGVQARKGRPKQVELRLEQPAVIAAERRVKNLASKPARKEPGLEQSTVIAAERRIEGLKGKAGSKQAAAPTPHKKAAARTAAKKVLAAVKKAPAAVKKAPATVKKVLAAVKKTPTAKRAPAAKKAPPAAKKAPPAAKKVPARKAAAAAKKAPAKKAPAKKAALRGRR